MRRLTFRTRLTLAYAAIVAGAVLLLGTIAFLSVQVALDTAFRTQLDTTVKSIRSIVNVHQRHLEKLSRNDREQFRGLLGRGLNGAVLDHDGRLVISNLSDPPPAALAAAYRANQSADYARIEAGDTEYVVMGIDDAGARYGSAVAWQSRAVYNDVATTTLIALGGAGCIVIVVAVVLGGVLTRRMLRPVTDLSAMIADIEASDLGERLAWDGPDDELGRLCSTFDRLLDRLQTAFERERRFVADASHELRTPLSVLRAEVELALMSERTPQAYRAVLERLRRETQRLETLTQRLLLAARQESGSLVMEPLALGTVVEEAVHRMSPLAASRCLELTSGADVSIDVAGDALMLESAVVALIDNALRFARTRVEVHVAFTDRGATVTVRDDGPGFSAVALREATERFWRDDPARAGDGTGLGLAIVRSAVERHGGTIALHNERHGGAGVVLTLPAKSGVIGFTPASPA